MAEIDDNKTTTYGNSDKNKTETYGNSENQKTNAYNSNQEATAAYNDLQNKEFKSKTHGIGVGDKLTLRNTEFTITEIISEGTGEAVIYKVENSSKQTFALKLYFEFSNHKEEPNYDTLHRIKNITDPDILRLYDFGVGVDKYLGKHCFEIADFAEGGNLFSVTNFKEKYKPEFIENHVVKEIYLGIRTLHENKIYHCDLKPQNVFYLDKNQTDLVIGDYGSAKAYDLETEKELRKSSTVKGTDAYLPPEQARGIISEKNDYYSLGMILIHLLYPDQLSKENDTQQIDRKKFEKIVERQYNSQPIVDFNPAYKRLNNLIEGLTLINHINRFGKNEVEKWLNGEEVEVKYSATQIDAVQPVKLGYATIKTDKDFIQILETRSTWWEDLFEDVDTYFAIKSWLGSYRNIASRKIFDEMIHFYKPMGKEYVKEAAIRYFQPDRSLVVDMNIFNFFTSENIIVDFHTYILKLDEIWKITSISRIKFYLFQLEFSIKQLKNSVTNETKIVVGSIIDKFLSVFNLKQQSFFDYKTEIQTKISGKDDLKLYYLFLSLFYLFNPQRSFIDLKNNQMSNIEEIGIYFIENEELYTNKFLIAEKFHFLSRNEKKHLLEVCYVDFLFEVFEKKKNALIEFCSFELISDNHCKVGYDLSESLSNFIESNNIEKVTVERKCKRNEITIKYGLFSNAKNLFHKTILQIRNDHKISVNAFNKNELEEFRQKFKKSCKRSFQLKNKITFISLSVIFGILSFYIIQNKFNVVFPVSEGINLYGDYLNYLICVALFTVIIYRIVIRKQPLKVRKSVSTLLSFCLFVFLAFNIWNAYGIHEKTKNYKHNFLLDSFSPTFTETYKLINVNNIADIFAEKWPPRRTGSTSSAIFNSNVTHTRLRNGFRINSAIPIVEGRFTDRGRSFLGLRIRWVANYREVSDFPYAKYIFTEMIPSNENRISKNLYSVQLKASLLDNSSKTGISIGDLDIVVSNNKIQLLKKDEFPKHLKSNFSSRPFYYKLTYNLEGRPFTEIQEISNSKPDFDFYLRIKGRGNYNPFGRSQLPRPVSQIHTQTIELNRQNDIDLTVNVDRNLVQVVLNNQLIMNYEYRLPEHSINLLSGLKSNILIKSINLNRITDNRLIEGKRLDQIKPTITAYEKPMNLMQSIGSPTVRNADENEQFEVLYKEKEHYRIKSLITNVLYYVSEEAIDKIENQ